MIVLLDESFRRVLSSEIRKLNLNDLSGSCFDLKLGPNISHARDSMTGTIKKQTNKKNLGKQGLENPRWKVGDSANIRETNFPKRHFITNK